MQNDQAENLRKEASDSPLLEQHSDQSLPSRSEVHGKRRENRKEEKQSKKEKRNSKFWLTRLLLGAFLLLIGFTLTYKYWSKNMYVPVHSEDKKGVEQVEIEH
jgi:hypothetical protein